MWERIRHIIRKEVLQAFSEPRMRVMLIMSEWQLIVVAHRETVRCAVWRNPAIQLAIVQGVAISLLPDVHQLLPGEGG